MEEAKERVVRLAKPVNKGIMRILFSRFFLIILLLVSQIALMVGLYLWFVKEQPWLLYVQVAFTIGMILYLFNMEMDTSAKLTWMLVISIAPFAGAVFLLFTQSNIGHRLETQLVKDQIDRTRHALKQPENVISEIEHDGSGTDDISRYLNRTGCFPVYDKTDVTYFPLGEDMFEAMLAELEKAEKFIFMEYFIIEEGYMWGRILDVLTRKAKEGLEVRVMYDGMCEIATLPVDYWKLLQEQGIHAKAFSEIQPIISSHYNYRDHRKILVIDGKVAFNGGVNLADEYINRIERFGHWKDTAVMIKGPAVDSFTLMFLQMWNVRLDEVTYDEWLLGPNVSKEVEEGIVEADVLLESELDELEEKDIPAAEPKLLEKEEKALAVTAAEDKAEKKDIEHLNKERDYDNENASGYVLPYCDCPLDEYKAGEAVYMDILNRATDYVYIMTPYLILDGELETSLKFAAQRGVDVRLILPGIPDKKTAYSLAKTHYRSLHSAGVKLYEYTPGFVHAKLFVSDDIKAVVGTINLDYRSLYHHFECATYMYKTECIKDIKKDFLETQEKCREVTDEVIENTPLSYRIMGGIMKAVAPLM